MNQIVWVVYLVVTLVSHTKGPQFEPGLRHSTLFFCFVLLILFLSGPSIYHFRGLDPLVPASCVVVHKDDAPKPRPKPSKHPPT